jgi:hypothetical protein
MENKKYGESTLYAGQTREEEKSPFQEDIQLNISEDERQELKDANQGLVKQKVVIDAVTGMTIGNLVRDEESDEPKTVNSILNNREIKGKTISLAGLTILKELLGHPVDAERLDILARCLHQIKNESEIEAMPVNAIKDIFGDEIINTLASRVPEQEREGVIKRLLTQMHASYIYQVQFNDDLSTLNKCMDMLAVDDTSKGATGNSILDATSKLESMLGTLSDIEKRSSIVQAKSFSIDDLDVRLLKELQVPLQKAASFETMLTAANVNAEKYSKDLKKKARITGKIESWIHELKTDADTLYPFPIDAPSDNVHDSYACDMLIRYLQQVKIMHTYGKVPEGYESVDDFVEKTVAPKEIAKIYDKSFAFTYVLSRAFKTNKIDTEDKRRELSYVLDMLAKAGHRGYIELISKTMDDVYDIIMKSNI